MPELRHAQALAVVVCVLACLPPLTRAQTVFRSDAHLVVLHTTVLGEDGHLVTDLPQASFRVFENGVAQRLKVFGREDIPVSLGLVIDGSASMLEKCDKVKSAALALVKASHPEDEVFIINFNERSYLDTDFTSDIQKLEEGLSRIDAQGLTAMRDAVRLSIEHLRRRAKEDKKVLLVVTDGEDNSSSVSLTYLVRTAQQSGVLVYAVGLLGQAGREETTRARRDLDALAKATGGQAYYLSDVSEVDQVAREIAHHIRNQYTLAYTPSNEVLDGSYRAIRVTVEDPRRLVVRTRTGYYALPKGAPVPQSSSDPMP
jgi:VWFA-related protein